MKKSTKIKKVQQRKVAAHLRMEEKKAKKLKCSAMTNWGFENTYNTLSYEDLSSLLGLPSRMKGNLD
jgi:hypothetical protein